MPVPEFSTGNGICGSRGVTASGDPVAPGNQRPYGADYAGYTLPG